MTPQVQRRIAIGLYVLVFVMCCCGLPLMAYGALKRQFRAFLGDDGVTDMISKPFQSNVVVEITVKDEDGNPLKANAHVSMFLPIGREGGEDYEDVFIDGAKRLEYRGVHFISIHISDDEGIYESDYVDWSFSDLRPDDFRFGPDGQTIIVRHDSVLRSLSPRRPTET
ncbi:hypothetical protein GC173_01155 [bacterium]|nr:hypothetical protein [bacterium]